MPVHVFRTEHSAVDLRRLARRESGRVCQRLLLIANLLDGAEREAAARVVGLGRQAAYDWHSRSEEEGVNGLRDRPRAVVRGRFRRPWSSGWWNGSSLAPCSNAMRSSPSAVSMRNAGCARSMV